MVTHGTGCRDRGARSLRIRVLACGTGISYIHAYNSTQSFLEDCMSYSMPDGPVVTIPTGTSDSPAMIADETISDPLEIGIKAPAALTGAVTIQVSFDFNKGY